MGELSEFDIGYIMGLIVGEGTFSYKRVYSTKQVHYYPFIAVAMHMRDPEPTQYLHSIFGGSLNGPYANGMITWWLSGHRCEALLPLLMKYLPASEKRRQFEVWHERFRPFFEKSSYRSI